MDNSQKKEVDSANFINERNFHVSERERNARKNGLLPDRLDPLDSSRSKMKNNQQVRESKTSATIPTSKGVTVEKREHETQSLIKEERSCISIAAELQDVKNNALRCYDINEIKKIVGLNDDNTLPICIAIIMSIISFTLGIYMTKKGLLDSNFLS